MKRIRYLCFIILFTLLAAEILLRLTGRMNVYSENMGRGYVSPYGTQKTWYRQWPTTYSLPHGNVDYNYPYSINNYGLRDKDYNEAKSDSVYRILVTGDSFAEGAGAPYDSTWPRLLEKILRDKNIPAEVIDAGESGSDVISDYVFYRDILCRLHPDLVIASMNSSDYIDYYFRGGMERFHSDGTVHSNRPPLIEYFYHYSHLFRAMYERNYHPFKGVYMSAEEYPFFLKRANAVFSSVINDYSGEVHKHGAKFVFMVHATPVEINSTDSLTHVALNNFETLRSLISDQGTPCIDLIKGLNNELCDKPWQYFTYTHDKHFNPTGYAAMAKLVCDSLVVEGALK